MKKQFFYTIILLSATIILGACRKEIDIDLEKADTRIVINSFFDTEDTFKVNISKSLSVLDDLNVKFITNAEVYLFENNTLIEQLQYTTNGFYKSNSFIPSEGKEYKIEAYAEGLKNATGTNVIPEAVQILNIDTASVMSTGNNWSNSEAYPQYQFKIKFKDPEGVSNFYALELKSNYKYTDAIDSTTYIEYMDLYYTTADPIFTDEDSHVFSDELIDGKEYELTINIDKYNFYSDTNYVQVKLLSVSEAYFLYKKSYSQYQKVKGNPFAEPVQVYNNIKNGYGIFAGFNSAISTIMIKGYSEVYYYEKKMSNN